jgi:hypothetical protein
MLIITNRESSATLTETHAHIEHEGEDLKSQLMFPTS